MEYADILDSWNSSDSMNSWNSSDSLDSEDLPDSLDSEDLSDSQHSQDDQSSLPSESGWDIDWEVDRERDQSGTAQNDEDEEFLDAQSFVPVPADIPTIVLDWNHTETLPFFNFTQGIAHLGKGLRLMTDAARVWVICRWMGVAIEEGPALRPGIHY